MLSFLFGHLPIVLASGIYFGGIYHYGKKLFFWPLKRLRSGYGPNLQTEQCESFSYGTLSLMGCRQREKGESCPSMAMGVAITAWQGHFQWALKRPVVFCILEKSFSSFLPLLFSPFAPSFFYCFPFIFNFSHLIFRYFLKWLGNRSSKVKLA